MKGEQQMNKRFKTGDLIRFGKFHGVVVGGDEEGGEWWVMPVGKNMSPRQRPIRIFQNLAVKVIA